MIDIVMLEAESEAFKIQALVEVDKETIIKAKVEKYVVATVNTDAVPLDALPREPSKEDMQEEQEQEEEGPETRNYSFPPTNYTPNNSPYPPSSP